MARESSGSWTFKAAILASVALFLGGVIGLPFYCSHHANTAGAGAQRDLQWAGWAFLSIEEVEHESSGDGHRLSLVDPLSGALLARRVLDVTSEGPACRFAPAAHLWCRWDGELRLLSAQSLKTVADWRTLAGLHPSLQGGLSPFTPQVDPVTGRLLVGTNDGLRVLLDPSRPNAEEAGEEPGLVALTHRANVTSGWQDLAGGRYAFAGDTATERQVLTRRDDRGGEPVKLRFSPEAGPDVPASTTYLKAAFLTPLDTRTGARGGLEGRPGLLIAHQTSLDDRQARRLVTRVTPDGEPLWTTELPLGRLEAAFLVADRLVLAQRGGCEETTALALADGRRLWTYAH